MLEKHTFLDWCQTLQLSEQARNLISQIGSSDPAHRKRACRNVMHNVIAAVWKWCGEQTAVVATNAKHYLSCPPSTDTILQRLRKH